MRTISKEDNREMLEPWRGTSPADLESDEGKKAITALHVHVDGIIDFVEKRKREPL